MVMNTTKTTTTTNVTATTMKQQATSSNHSHSHHPHHSRSLPAAATVHLQPHDSDRISNNTTDGLNSNENKQQLIASRQRRLEREEWLSQWAHVVWTKRQSPEWKPRRASVATCQLIGGCNLDNPVNGSCDNYHDNQQQPPPLINGNGLATLMDSSLRRYLNQNQKQPQQQQVEAQRFRRHLNSCGSRFQAIGGRRDSSGELGAKSSISSVDENQAIGGCHSPPHQSAGGKLRSTLYLRHSPSGKILSVVETAATTASINPVVTSSDPIVTGAAASSLEPVIGVTGRRRRLRVSQQHPNRTSLDSQLADRSSGRKVNLLLLEGCKQNNGTSAATSAVSTQDTCWPETVDQQKARITTTGTGTRLAACGQQVGSSLSGQLQSQDERRKSLIYLMTLKQMMISSQAKSKDNKELAAEVDRKLRLSSVSATPFKVSSSAPTMGSCVTQLAGTEQHSKLLARPQQATEAESVSETRSSSQQRDEFLLGRAAELAATHNGTTTPMTCNRHSSCSASTDQVNDIDGAVAETTPRSQRSNCCKEPRAQSNIISCDGDNDRRQLSEGVAGRERLSVDAERIDNKQLRSEGRKGGSRGEASDLFPVSRKVESTETDAMITFVCPAAVDSTINHELVDDGEQLRRVPSSSGNCSSQSTGSCDLEANLSEIESEFDSESQVESSAEKNRLMMMMMLNAESGHHRETEEEVEEEEDLEVNERVRGSRVGSMRKPEVAKNSSSTTSSTATTTAATSAAGCCCEQQEQQEQRDKEIPEIPKEQRENNTTHALQCNDFHNLESLIVESWLDDHPAFMEDYFMRKANRQLIDNWLVTHAKVSNTNLSSQLDFTAQTLQHNLQQQYSSHHSHSLSLCSRTPSASTLGPSSGLHRVTARPSSQSGHATPVRKISATDFESRTGSGFLRPMVSTTPDGRPTFLSQPIPNSPSPTPSLDELQASGDGTGNVKTLASSMSEKAKQVSSVVNDDVGARGPDLRNESDGLKTATDSNDLEEDEETTINREVKLIFELVKNICNDLDIRTLLHKILKNIAVLINADKSSLFLVCGQPGDPNRHLVSQLFNVDQDSEVSGHPDEDRITIPWGTGLVGYVAESGESLNIANCYDDPRFTDTIDQRTGYVTRHMLCAPILDKRNEIVGVAQVINKRDGNAFSRSDELKFKRYLQFCGIGLRNAQSYEHCQLENRRNQVLLDLARMVFEEQSTIEQVVYRIMLHTQSLLECQRCQVLLIDDGSDDLEQLLQLPSGYQGASNQPGVESQDRESHPKPEWRPQCNASARSEQSDADHKSEVAKLSEGYLSQESARREQHLEQQLQSPMMQSSSKLFSLVFDLECDGNDPVMHSSKEKAVNSGASPDRRLSSGRFPINIGITGYVAMTGETLNIEDAHQNERFDPSVDEGSNFRHKSILCMPIRNGQRQIIGVSQLINKKNGRPFNKNDEDLFEAFAIFCGLGIHNTLMYEKVLKIMAKQRVTFEVLSYHATAPLEEAKKLNSETIPSCFALNLTSLKFNDFSLDEQFMLKSCLRFFLDLDLIRRFQIDQLVFCNWILSVQKNYRKLTYHPIVGGNGLKASPVRYHNWRHAFNVSQMMFAILINTQICQALGELETLALLIACLCHDLDHRGTNNSFQIKSASPLAELYSTSTMEHHHFDQCVMILNSQGNQILANLSPDEYSRVIVLLEEAILATDLANYFQKRELFFQLVNGNQFEWQSNPEHRSLLRCMLMTGCDVAAITKPWPVQKVVADLVMSEFYQQGDIEKQELNIEPIDMMNRDKMSKLPEMQIGFIDSICAPIYAAFARLFPRELGPLLEGCLSNRNIWTEMARSNQSELPLVSYLNNNNNNNNNNNHNISNNNNNSKNKNTSAPTITKLPEDATKTATSARESCTISPDTTVTTDQSKLYLPNQNNPTTSLNRNEQMNVLNQQTKQPGINGEINISKVYCQRRSV